MDLGNTSQSLLSEDPDTSVSPALDQRRQRLKVRSHLAKMGATLGATGPGSSSSASDGPGQESRPRRRSWTVVDRSGTPLEGAGRIRTRASSIGPQFPESGQRVIRPWRL